MQGEINEELSDDELFHINIIDKVDSLGTLDKDKWTPNCQYITRITFRIDTEAKCSIIAKSDFEKLNSITCQKFQDFEVLH